MKVRLYDHNILATLFESKLSFSRNSGFYFIPKSDIDDIKARLKTSININGTVRILANKQNFGLGQYVVLNTQYSNGSDKSWKFIIADMEKNQIVGSFSLPSAAPKGYGNCAEIKDIKHSFSAKELSKIIVVFVSRALNIDKRIKAVIIKESLENQEIIDELKKSYKFDGEALFIQVASKKVSFDPPQSSSIEKDSEMAPDDKKNDSKGGTRYWEQKSSKRRDGIPGGNTGADYISKGDHGQAGFDKFFDAVGKLGDYTVNRTASKKYRI